MKNCATDEYPEIALALTRPESLERVRDLGPAPAVTDCLRRLNCPPDSIEDRAAKWPVGRIYLGNEFCERLIPKAADLQQAQEEATGQGMELTLVTPMVTDFGLERIEKLLPRLGEGSEVVINDWGVLQRVRTAYPALKPVLGRMLNKMIKDPRLPSADWTRLHPHTGRQSHFQGLLARFGIDHLEMDVPPFARPDQFEAAPMTLSVHLPYGYTVKGRMCRIGSLHQKGADKFRAAHACRKECLHYWVEAKRPGRRPDAELMTFQRGNSQFYRHSSEMAAALWRAVEQKRIKRLIFSGDWHENYRAA